MFTKNKFIKYTGYIVTSLIIILYAIDFITYLNGGITSKEYLSITQPQADNPAGYFTVNNKYWGIGGSFQHRKMIIETNPENTEIRFVQTEDFLNENKCTIYYLPISKFIMKIEIPITETPNLELSTLGVFTV